MEEFNKGDRVEVIHGLHKGRGGTLLRKCSVVFADYVRVEFDLRKRERVVKTAIILKSELKKIS